MGTNTSLSPVSTLGHQNKMPQSLLLGSSQPQGKNLTLLSSMSLCGMGPSLAVDGPIDREVFEA
jgi:hypothetical protein